MSDVPDSLDDGWINAELAAEFPELRGATRSRAPTESSSG